MSSVAAVLASFVDRISIQQLNHQHNTLGAIPGVLFITELKKNADALMTSAFLF
mgnify:CR=1 FL=1